MAANPARRLPSVADDTAIIAFIFIIFLSSAICLIMLLVLMSYLSDVEGSMDYKYCDLVMKGGITSGIVYPTAVLELSKQYRFKNIGGTSAGAIAAAVTAAAALGDRRKKYGEEFNQPDKVGFEGLKSAAEQLCKKGFILSLFQPTFGARRAFRTLVFLTGKARAWRKVVRALTSIFLIAPFEFIAVLNLFLVVGYLLGGEHGVFGAIVPGLICSYLTASIFAVRRICNVARKNYLGLCSGMGSPTFIGSFRFRPVLSLTEWLHIVIQELSGKPPAEPVTFGDLRAARKYPDEPTQGDRIRLQVITTCISHHEPRTIPFLDGNFWFLENDFARLFPNDVVEWMIKHSRKKIDVGGKRYRLLPHNDQLPIIVGMRMSLSFPVLISAVPLYEQDRNEHLGALLSDSAHENRLHGLAESTEALAIGASHDATDTSTFRICWFSDGGISSNFPVHLFDGPLPKWPTFAINLVYADPPTSPDLALQAPTSPLERYVSLPSTKVDARPQYNSINSPIGIGEIARFVFAIISTMQNWRDLLQSRAPGFRDRICRIYLTEAEGGMNLNMTNETLGDVAQKGAIAGQRFTGFSFTEHYWIRWRNLASAMQRYTLTIYGSQTDDARVPSYSKAYALPQSSGDVSSYEFTPKQALESQRLHEWLIERGATWADNERIDLSTGAPTPLPQMQIVPTY